MGSLGFPWWFVFLEGSFKRVAQGYNCGNLPAENQREKKRRKALCLGYCPVWTGPVDSRRVISISSRQCTRQWPWQCYMLGLPSSFFNSRFSFLPNESTRPIAHGQIWHHRRAKDALNRRAVVWMWNADLWEQWIRRRGETRQGGATHGLFLGGKVATLSPARFSLASW